MRQTIIAFGLAFVLVGCGQGLSSGKATSMAMEHWRENGITMDGLDVCGRFNEGCLAAAECIEPATAQRILIGGFERDWGSMSNTVRLEQIIMQFPAFKPVDVRIEELSDRYQDGARVGTTLRERADFVARVVPSDVVAAYADCPAFAELAASIEQPVTFDAGYEGEQRTNNGMVSVEWRLTHLYRNPNP